MDKEAVSNRCLWDVTEMPAGSHWDLSRATEVRDPYEGSVQGLQLVGPHPRSMDLFPRRVLTSKVSRRGGRNDIVPSSAIAGRV